MEGIFAGLAVEATAGAQHPDPKDMTPEEKAFLGITETE